MHNEITVTKNITFGMLPVLVHGFILAFLENE